MIVRRARSADRNRILNLAMSLGLDYEEMAGDPFWVAEVEGRLAGIVGLRTHPDCRELVALGVAPDARGRGVGRALVDALFAEAEGDVHLVTSIPEYFARLGFAVAAPAPASLSRRKGSSWCDGCAAPERCTIMVRRTR